MVVLFVIFTILLFVTVDYFIQKKKKIGFAVESYIPRIPLTKIFHLVPEGIFIQPTLTWSKILDSGELVMGIHPILMGMIGEPDEIEVIRPGESVQKGEVLAVIRKGSRALHVKSPVEGAIIAINEEVINDPTWENVSKNWIYAIRPKKIDQEVPQWLIAEKAQAWTHQKYEQIKQFFMSLAPRTDLGITMADGGDIPVGILSEFDEQTWKKFEERFCNQNA